MSRTGLTALQLGKRESDSIPAPPTGTSTETFSAISVGSEAQSCPDFDHGVYAKGTNATIINNVFCNINKGGPFR